jgi:hypothetical protein
MPMYERGAFQLIERLPGLVCKIHARARAGMPAEIFVRTRERSALEYLLEPLTNTLRRAAREA